MKRFRPSDLVEWSEGKHDSGFFRGLFDGDRDEAGRASATTPSASILSNDNDKVDVSAAHGQGV